MKKRFGIKKAVDVIPPLELNTMQTRALLAQLKRLRWCYEGDSVANDYTQSEIKSVSDKILFKTDPRWKAAYRDVKAVLATREKIDTKI